MTRRKTTWTELAWNTFVCLALSPPAILATTIATFVLAQVAVFTYHTIMPYPSGTFIIEGPTQVSPPTPPPTPPFTPPQINTLDNQELPVNQLPIPLIVTNPYIKGYQGFSSVAFQDEDIKFLCLATPLLYRGECDGLVTNPAYDPRRCFDQGYLTPGTSIGAGVWVTVVKDGCRYRVTGIGSPY